MRQILETDNGRGTADWLRANYCSFPEFWFVDQLMLNVQHVHNHYEGDVWEHTLLVMQRMSEQPHDYLDMLCALLHDIGKKDALEKNNGKNMSGHELLGVPIAKQWLETVGAPEIDIRYTCMVIENHMKAIQLVSMKSKYDCWKFINDPLFPRYRRLAVADSLGTLNDDGRPKMDYEAELANSVAGYCMRTPMPESIVTVSDLVEYDIDDTSYVLNQCHKIQINGGMTDKKTIIKNAMRNLKQRKYNE